jgi:hypothetical protein
MAKKRDGLRTAPPARPSTSEFGVKAIGHSGFFRERIRDSLWRETADRLEGP